MPPPPRPGHLNATMPPPPLQQQQQQQQQQQLKPPESFVADAAAARLRADAAAVAAEAAAAVAALQDDKESGIKGRSLLLGTGLRMSQADYVPAQGWFGLAQEPYDSDKTQWRGYVRAPPPSSPPAAPTLEELCSAARREVLLRLGVQSPDAT